MQEIVIKSIPHDEHRYETAGDYWLDDEGIQQVRVSEMDNDDYEFLVALHELVELTLAKKRNIKEEDITEFDELYEESRKHKVPAPCGCVPTEDSEPGNDKHAPYFKEHQFATKIERLMAKQLKVNWEKYDKTINEL